LTSMTGPYLYEAFGLRIRSEFALPELFECDRAGCEVEIVRASLEETWRRSAARDDIFVMQGANVLFRIPEVGLFSAEGGRTLRVCPLPGGDEERLRLYILGTGMGLILLQRRTLPLHGSCVEIGGKAYVIVGHSGTGKSTLSSVLLSRGYRLLSDDVIPIVFSGQTPVAVPSYPQQKLWQDSMNELGMTRRDGRPIYNRETKFAVPAHDYFQRESLPLAGVFELVKAKGEPFIAPIPVLERYYVLFHHTYRNFYVTRAGLMDWHFGTLARFVNRIGVYRIGRSTTAFSAHESADRMLEAIDQGVNRDE